MKKNILIFSLIMIVALSFNNKVYAYGNSQDTIYIQQYDNYLSNLKGTLFNEQAVKNYLGNSNYDSLINYVNSSGYSNYICMFKMVNYEYESSFNCYFSDKETLQNTFYFTIWSRYGSNYLRFNYDFNRFGNNSIYNGYFQLKDNVLSLPSSLSLSKGSPLDNLADYNSSNSEYSVYQYKTLITNIDNFKVKAGYESTGDSYNYGISFKVDNEQYYINDGDTLIYRDDGEGYLNINDYDVNGPINSSDFPIQGDMELLIPHSYQSVAISGIKEGKIFVAEEDFNSYQPWLNYMRLINGSLTDNPYPVEPYKWIIDDTGKRWYYWDFDLTKVENSKFVLYEKVSQTYEGYYEDVSYSIYYPQDAYISLIKPVRDENGNPSWDFPWKDPDTGDINHGNITNVIDNSSLNTFFDNLINYWNYFNNNLKVIFSYYKAFYVELPSSLKLFINLSIYLPIFLIVYLFIKE